jgi:outer membrane protein OmpA-like peptidoglycan-associated protein
MVPRVRVLSAAILGFVFAIATYAQDTPKLFNSQLPSATDTATSGFRPANPYFGNALAVVSAPKANSSDQNENAPAVELFGGYSYIRFNDKRLLDKENFDLHGGTGSIAGNVNRWFGLVADFAGYKVTGLPSGTSGSASTFLFGPKFSHRGERWTPFAQFLFGFAHVKSDVTTPLLPGSGSDFFSLGSFHQNAFATALGGGFDLSLTKHVAWRVVQAEYLFTKFPDGNNNQQNNIRAATGLVFRFGGGPPPPPPNHPPTISLSANPNKLTVGDSAVLQAQASDPDNDTLTYAWTSTCGNVEGTGAEVHLNSASIAPGTCTVTVKADDARGGNASASTDVTVEARPNHPPTVSCAASSQTVTAGQPVNLTATGNDPDNDQLTYSWTSSGGKVTGSGAQAQFDTTGLQPGHYTVTCHADDGKGGTADGTADIEVQAPAEQKRLETRLSLHSIYFPTAQPTAANPNGGLLPSQQNTLTTLAQDFAQYLSFRKDAHLILQGHADPRGGADYNKALSDRRVERTKQFLVEHGVSADAIETQGLGEEQPMSVDQVKQAVDQDTNLTDAQKKQLTAKAGVLALAQSRRVDVTLSTTGQTSVRQFPFNAEDALNLINPKGVSTAKPRAKGKTAPKGKGTKKGATKKTP